MRMRSIHSTGPATRLSIVLAASALILVVFGGCSGFGVTNSGWLTSPWSKKPAETVDKGTGIRPPHERLAELRELAKKGPTTTPDQQQEVARRLAQEFRVEEDPLIRAQIVRTLTTFRTDDATSVLRDATDDDSIDVRITACRAWGRRGGPEAIELLGQRVAGDNNADVRLAATRALGETGDQGAVAKLGPALDDPDPALQYREVLSLRKITGKHLDNDVDQWRQYVRGETPTPREPTSVADRLRRLF
jgi:HEAT repeat protein